MHLSFDYNNILASGLVSRADIDACNQMFIRANEALTEKLPEQTWRGLPDTASGIIDDIENTAAYIGSRFKNFVVLGIGGSALGPIAVQNALNGAYYNMNPKRKTPAMYVADNVDPAGINDLLNVLDPKDTMFNVITKSGATSETMSQLMIITSLLKDRLGERFSENLIATTDSEKGNLIKIARRLGLKTFYIPNGVGGRFSELCPVGLLPAAVCGINIRELLNGARAMRDACSSPDMYKNPAAMYAVLHTLLIKKGVNISVFMPYSDRLKYVSDWYCQLWAESLGKTNQAGERIGQTPVKALGVTDQHSQIQLYTEGPRDKVITLVSVQDYGVKVGIDCDLYEDLPDVHFLSGHSLNELIQSENRATEYALTKAGQANCTITLPSVNEYTLGGLLFMLEMATAYAGEFLGVNAFNQPGVEEGKNATYALLGKKGYSDKRAEFERAQAKRAEYITEV